MESSGIPPASDPATPGQPPVDPGVSPVATDPVTPADPTHSDPTPPPVGDPGAPVQEAPPVVDPATAVKDDDSKVADLLQQLVSSQQQYRADVQALRDEVNAAKTAPASVAPTSPEAAVAQRQQEIEEADFYCPGCGKLLKAQIECTGNGEAPHPPIEPVSADELRNAPDPATDPEGYKKWQQDHTAAPATGV